MKEHKDIWKRYHSGSIKDFRAILLRLHKTTGKFHSLILYTLYPGTQKQNRCSKYVFPVFGTAMLVLVYLPNTTITLSHKQSTERSLPSSDTPERRLGAHSLSVQVSARMRNIRGEVKVNPLTTSLTGCPN